MLINEPAFKHGEIAAELLRFYSRQSKVHFFSGDNERIVADLKPDFVTIASSKYLVVVVSEAVKLGRGRVPDSVIAYALGELIRRKYRIPESLYEKLLKLFRTEKFGFTILPGRGPGSFILEQLIPDK